MRATERAAVAPWQRVAARMATPVLALVVAVWVLSRVLVPPPPALATLDPMPWHLAMIAFGIVGVVIVARRPDNVVGWLFLIVGVFDPLTAAVRSIAIADMGGRALPAADIAAWAQAWMWAPSLGALALLVWVFPTGRPLPGIWRWGAGLAVAALLVLLVPVPIAIWPYRGDALLAAEETSLPGIAGLLADGGFALLMLTAAAGAVSLIVRFHRSEGTERQQLKWFALAAALTMVQAFTDIVVLDRLGIGESMAREVLSSLTLVLVPLSAGIALTRHRLYDIDRLINRTVVYGALTAGCAATYFGLVAAVRLLTAPITGETNVAVAASTLAVAALFRPARRRVQEAVDRRFNRARYDVAQTVAAFNGRLRNEVDLDALTAELVAVVDHTMQPTNATLWLRGHTK